MDPMLHIPPDHKTGHPLRLVVMIGLTALIYLKLMA